MKSITEALAEHLAGDTMTTARLWKIKRKATTQVAAVQAYVAGPNYSDPSCNQAQTGSDWEFVNGEWRTTAGAIAGELDWLYAYGFNFSIPSTATIIGVVASVVYSSDSRTTAYIDEVSLFNSGVSVGTEKTPQLQFTPSQQTMSLGGKTDLWGYALTPAIVNSSSFGFGLRAFYDSVRLYLNGASFALTVYYTLPASGVSSASKLVMASTLVKHTNFSGGVAADTSADATSGLPGEQIIDVDNVLYLYSPYGASLSLQGQVRMFNSATGEYLGLLGTFPNDTGQGNMRPSGGMYILNHPTYGKWLLMSAGTVWGGAFQLMAIAGKDVAGNPVAPGTLTNALIPMNDGIHAGNNTGTIDVDAAGNIWIFGQSWDSIGSVLGPPTMWQFTFTGTNTVAQIASTNFATLYGWTTASGVRCDPVTGTLIVWGQDSGSAAIAARLDQTSGSFPILASSGTLPTYNVPMNMGSDGAYVVGYNFTYVAKIRASDFTVLQTNNLSTDYGLSNTINRIWYDGVNGFAWVNFQGFYSIAVVDLSNISPSGQTSLTDSQIAGEGGLSNSELCGLGGMNVSPDGSVGVTVMAGGGPEVAFIDFWGIALPSAGGVPISYVAMGFTDHDLDIIYDDGSGDGPITYIARTGATWSAIESKPDMSVDNLDIDSFLESDAITEGDIRGGLYDGAECTIYLVNWADLTQKHLTLRYGVFGKVKIVNGLFTTEIRGLAYALGFTIGDYYGPLCRAELFSTPQNSPGRQWYCNLNATLFTQNGTVASSSDALHITPNPGLVAKGSAGGPAPAGWFDFGLITFTSGANQNLKYEIESWDGSILTLEFPLAYPAAPGDTFTIEPGCDKLLTTCINKFNNAVNHRGEAWIPGLDAVLDIFPSA